MSDSPTWRKPSDVMKIRRRKSLAARALTVTPSNTEPMSSLPSSTLSACLVKRKNPFSCSSLSAPVKRLNLDKCLPRTYDTTTIDCSGNDCSKEMKETCNECSPQDQNEYCRTSQVKESDIPLFRGLNGCTQISSDAIRSELNSQHSLNFSKEDQKKTCIEELFTHSTEISNHGPTFPIDWSLKTKARFVSSVPFHCCSLLRSSDQVQGMMAFVRGSIMEGSIVDRKNPDDGFAKQRFQSNLMFWMHPNIPWLPSFPRIITSVRPSQNIALMTDEIRKSLLEDWSESMNAAYQSVRTGVCPYVYVCCHHLTILFRGAIESDTEMNALLTPTTRGLRESLKSDGIEFRLPLYDRNEANKFCQNTVVEANQSLSEVVPNSGSEEYDENELLTNDSAVNWLEELGLDRKRFRSVEPSKVRDQKDRYREIDNRPESTVLIEGGANTQALFNYLLNYSSLIPSTGPQGGLPPTILSPVAFKGATLHSLKTRQGNVLRANNQGQKEQAFSIEITGPILPHSIHGLSSLFSKTQPEFSASFAVHDPTVPFNCDVENEDNDSFGQTQSKSVLGHASSLKRNAVRELIQENGLFWWSVY